MKIEPLDKKSLCSGLFTTVDKFDIANYADQETKQTVNSPKECLVKLFKSFQIT